MNVTKIEPHGPIIRWITSVPCCLTDGAFAFGQPNSTTTDGSTSRAWALERLSQCSATFSRTEGARTGCVHFYVLAFSSVRRVMDIGWILDVISFLPSRWDS
jgi:hypothetical protein